MFKKTINIILFLFLIVLSSSMVNAWLDEDPNAFSKSGYSESFFYGSKERAVYSLYPDLSSGYLRLSIESQYNSLINTNDTLLTDNLIDGNEENTEIVGYDYSGKRFIILRLSTSQIQIVGVYYTGKSLNALPVIYDWNNDGTTEIIYSLINGSVESIQYNSSTNFFERLTTQNFNNSPIVSIRCANFTGYETIRGSINDSGLHCTMIDNDNVIHQFNNSYSYDWLNFSVCNLETRTLIQPNGYVYPHLITNVDNSPNFEISYSCTPTSEVINDRGLVFYTYDSNNNTLNTELVNPGKNTLCNNHPTAITRTMGISTIDVGSGNNAFLYSGISCKGDYNQKYAVVIKDINGNLVNNVSYSGDDSGCNAGTSFKCSFIEFLPIMTRELNYNLDPYPGDEFCIGGTIDQSGLVTSSDVLNCYESGSNIPLISNEGIINMSNKPYGSYFEGWLFEGIPAFFFVSDNTLYSYDLYSNTSLVLKRLSDKDGVYYVSSLNDDSVYDYMSVDSSGLKIHASFIENNAPVITSIDVDTGLKVCKDNIVTYSVSFSDDDNDPVRGRIDCYGNGTYNNYTAYKNDSSTPLTLFCNYSMVKSFSPVITIVDINGDSDTYNLDSGVVVDDVPPNCFIGGSGGYNVFTGSRPDSIALDVESQVNDLTLNWSVTTKYIFALLCILLTLLSIAFADISGSAKSIAMTVISVLMVMGFSLIGFIPAWMILILFLISGLGFFVMIGARKSGVA